MQKDDDEDGGSRARLSRHGVNTPVEVDHAQAKALDDLAFGSKPEIDRKNVTDTRSQLSDLRYKENQSTPWQPLHKIHVPRKEKD
jgi:hypothetical protein